MYCLKEEQESSMLSDSRKKVKSFLDLAGGLGEIA
jgi:hypothetical protein